MVLLDAVVAAGVGGLTDAGNAGEWPVKKPNEMPNADGVRRAFEEITAHPALAALQDAVVAELEQNGFEKVPWDVKFV